MSTCNARQLFLEDNGNIDMKDNYKITSVHPPTYEKDAVNKKFYDNNALSSSTTKALQISHCQKHSFRYSHRFSQNCTYD